MGSRTALLALALAALAAAQGTEEDYAVYKEHPRLLLTPQRLRLLRREKERNSARWQQFDTLMRGKAQMAEPGFSNALYFQVAASEEHGKQAVQWALGTGADLRQLAIVYDWCQPVMSTADAAALRKKIAAGLHLDWASASLPAARTFVFGTIAIADDLPDAPKYLKEVVNTWWRKHFSSALKSGPEVPLNADLYPLFELLHAVRDNTGIELRDDAPRYFRDLPAMELLSYYPATFPAPENDFRIPAFTGKGEPDLKAASMSRVAELAMVAYDNNATDSQFVQGWVLHDRFILHSAFGAPYEFLWANPYQPGLSFHHLPLTIHDARGGRVFLRSSWDDDATWLGYLGGELQVFQDGRIRQITMRGEQKLISIGPAAVVPGRPDLRFDVPQNGPSVLYVLGLKPRHPYQVEVDDEELDEETTDPSGNLALVFTRTDARKIRIADR